MAPHLKNSTLGYVWSLVAANDLVQGFAALRRPMDINLDDLPYVIYACFVLHNFCEFSKEAVDEQNVSGTILGERASQPPTQSNRFRTDCNEGEGKRVRRVLTNYLDP